MPKARKTSKIPKAPDFLEGGFELPKAEERVLEFWKQHRIFEKSMELRAGRRAKTFVFYEGPPGANGRPGTHHVLARVFKDIICRYRTMRGYYVPRKSGWDTHGLPVEITAEKELGLKSKAEIEEYGIAAFNKKCREVVWRYQEEWERLTDRIGFWLDLKHPYVTYESDYIETLWWIVKKISEKGLLYKGHKVVPWCPRCGTSLSSHELALGYKEVTDRSVYMKFKVLPGQKIGSWESTDKTYILSWTTTPWTLPGNVALAVGEDIEYAEVTSEGENIFIAKELVSAAGLSGSIGGKFKGKDLVGVKYEPLFDVPQLRSEKSHQVYAADFVTTTDGTGVVHTAVMYGEDDYRLGAEAGLPQYHTVTEEGKFKADVPAVGGLYAKAKETEDVIFEHLRASGTLFKTHDYKHEYPHCWRCDTPLLYYARTSWFIAMSKLRKELAANNKKVNWVPKHFRDGRFGEWLREAKDWNFTRERYWGTPFPVWECGACEHWEAIGGLKELEHKLGRAKNEYWVMRHGEAETNLFKIIDSGEGNYHLTPKGKRQAEAAAIRLKRELKKAGKEIDLIIHSPIMRTRETAEIVQKVLGVKESEANRKLYEIMLGKLAGCHDDRYHEQFPTYEDKFSKAPESGETLRDLRARLWAFLEEMERRHEGKRILIVSHEYPIWMLTHAAEGWTERNAILEKERRGSDFIRFAEYRPLAVRNAPRNETGEVDLHRPYADAPSYPCAKCGGKMERVKSVVDVWYDSGAMPFAQWHYPFEKQAFIDKRERFPADYICEAVDQTRGWFYTLLAVSTLLGYESSFKNVICLGHINDKHGKKMSKSKGNVIDPWELIGKHGIDAVRWYFYTATPPGEPKNFDEQEVVKFYRNFHGILYNSYVFWKTYAKQGLKLPAKPRNVLDEWILARLAETVNKMTAHLDRYEIREAGLLLEEFTGDLSRWYIRRSRRRLQKGEDPKDFAAASATLEHILRAAIRLAAPFTPFFAEALHGSLERKGSVHLADWPAVKASSAKKLLKDMEEVRRLASLALAKRAELGLKVRQPLRALKVKNVKSGLARNKALLEILKDEVNVKEIVFNERTRGEIELDTKISQELLEEGIVREVIRTVQELRQKAALKPKDKIVLLLDLPRPALGAVQKHEESVKKDVGAKTIEYHRSEKFASEMDTKLGDAEAWLGLRKA